MILTISLNPAIDLTMEVDSLRLGHTNRVVSITEAAGGKGVNVSRLLRRFGCDSTTFVVVGGHSGQRYLDIASKAGLLLHAVEVKTTTRVNTVITDKSKDQHTKVDQTGSKLCRTDIKIIQKDYNNLLPQCDNTLLTGDKVLFAGGNPPEFPLTEYRKMLRAARRSGVRVFIDLRGEALRIALSEKPWLVKPNLGELEEATGKSLRSKKALFQRAQEIIDSGVENLVVTLGAKGAYWFTKEETLFCAPPEHSNQPTLAAGDSMMAGILMALEEGKEAPEALRWGTAMSCATALAPGTSLATPKEFRRLRKLCNKNYKGGFDK